jgi:hypothetical protein
LQYKGIGYASGQIKNMMKHKKPDWTNPIGQLWNMKQNLMQSYAESENSAYFFV